MTRDELLFKLRELGARPIPEEAVDHSIADDLLLEFIDDSDIKEAYDKIPKWYS